MASIEPKIITTTDGSRLRIRTANTRDVQAMFLHREHMALTSEHNVTEHDEFDRNEEKLLASLRDYAEKPGWLYLIAEHEHDAPEECGPILGTLSFHNGSRRKLEHHGDFGISVAAAWRGKGIGRALIEILLEWATAHEQIEKVCLGVFATNERAIQLYHRLGFRKEGVRRGFFKLAPGVYVDDLQMSKWVKERRSPES